MEVWSIATSANMLIITLLAIIAATASASNASTLKLDAGAPEGRAFGLVEPEVVYRVLVSDAQVFKVIVIGLFHLMFQTLGWLVVSTVWSSLRCTTRRDKEKKFIKGYSTSGNITLKRHLDYMFNKNLNEYNFLF